MATRTVLATATPVPGYAGSAQVSRREGMHGAAQGQDGIFGGGHECMLVLRLQSESCRDTAEVDGSQ